MTRTPKQEMRKLKARIAYAVKNLPGETDRAIAGLLKTTPMNVGRVRRGNA